MKKIKVSIVVCAVLMALLALSACGGGGQGIGNPYGGTFTVDEIQGRPENYVGLITIVGIVGTSDTQDFSLQNEAGTFEILVDYLGSQALPRLGDRVSVGGTLRENRPCCGPGFTLTSTRFDEVE